MTYTQRQNKQARRRQLAQLRQTIGYAAPRLLGVLGFVWVLGLVGAVDHKTEVLEQRVAQQGQMSAVCHQAEVFNDRKLGKQCGELIAKVQADGKYEVIQYAGYYWAEAKR